MKDTIQIECYVCGDIYSLPKKYGKHSRSWHWTFNKEYLCSCGMKWKMLDIDTVIPLPIIKIKDIL